MLGIGIGIGAAGLGDSARRDDPWTPPSESGLALWVRADLWSASQWTDQSGAGHNGAQASGSKQGALNASWHNGQPAISFDGGDVYDFAATITADIPWSVFIVLQFSSVATGRFAFNIGSAANGFGGSVNIGATGKREMFINGVTIVEFGNATTNAEAWLLTNGVRPFPTNTEQNAYVNGSLAGSAPSATVTAPSGEAHIGGRTNVPNFPFLGHIAEFAAWDHELATEARDNLFAYSLARYGL